MDANNDNDTWTSLGFQTLLILNRLTTERQLTGAEQTPERNEAKKEERDEDGNDAQESKSPRRKLSNVL